MARQISENKEDFQQVRRFRESRDPFPLSKWLYFPEFFPSASSGSCQCQVAAGERGAGELGYWSRRT